MAECTMEELLRAPTEGYGEAIVLPEINADHFEIKTNFFESNGEDLPNHSRFALRHKFRGCFIIDDQVCLPTIKSLLMNKEKLLELVKIPLNENCSAMLLKKILEKLGDPGKFLIPCNFPGMDDSFKKFTDEPALVCVPPSEDDNDEKEKQEVKNLAESTAKRQTHHLDAQERKQDKSTLETPVDFEEEILDADVQENEVIPLYDE
ncbi:hypothetical protein Tco_0816669 [Tanacetum coccineum]